MAYYMHKKNAKQFKADAKSNLRIFENQKNVLLIRKLLSSQDQIDLTEAVMKAEDQCKSIKLINKNPDSTTIMVINPKNAYQSKYRSSPIYEQLFKKALTVIDNSKIKTELPGLKQIKKLKIDRIKGLEYDVNGGKIEPHCDCRKGYVMIFSLGHTANFHIKGANMKRRKDFECRNSDCLIFDTSKKADIIHEISSIKPNSYEPRLAAKYPRFLQSRICVMIGYQ